MRRPVHPWVWLYNTATYTWGLHDPWYTIHKYKQFLQRPPSRWFDDHSEVKAQPKQRAPFSIPTTVVLAGHTFATLRKVCLASCKHKCTFSCPIYIFPNTNCLLYLSHCLYNRVSRVGRWSKGKDTYFYIFIIWLDLLMHNLTFYISSYKVSKFNKIIQE